MIIGNEVSKVEFGNVEHGGEFKIRNSAKAFSILSSGLYANKIRAIVRELSCNAIDSHKAAGNTDKQFDVHLPTRMEPYFFVRDYGTGLSHEDVMSIYTTYFESTKSGSNDFIGALGLGSKSPFSYTDNFTVTAIKNGEKNIYTAYINEQGLPSITRMSNSESDEPSGVQVHFAVKEVDFYRFSREAEQVYSVFELHPNVLGGSYNQIKFEVIQENIIDGVNLVKANSVFSGAVAIMGNVAYPIEVPNREENLGVLSNILDNPLVIKFNIGELDVQASREGLSYIPLTIKSIKDKLTQINAMLMKTVEKTANDEKNMWKRRGILVNLSKQKLFAAAVSQYLNNSKFVFTYVDGSGNRRIQDVMELKVEDIAEKYNILLSGYQKNYRGKVSRLTMNSYDGMFDIRIASDTTFVKNDITRGIGSRAMEYCRSTMDTYGEVIVMSAFDKDKEIKYDAFLKSIHHPTTINASDITYVKKTYSRSISGGVFVADRYNKWADYKWNEFDIENVDEDEIYYYVPVKGKMVVSENHGECSVEQYLTMFERVGIDAFSSIKLYGVRKNATKEIESLDNWVKFEDYVADVLKKEAKDDSSTITTIVVSGENVFDSFGDDVIKLVAANSPIKKLHDKYKKYDTNKYACRHTLNTLMKKYVPSFKIDDAIDKVTKEFHNVRNRYPLVAGKTGFDARHVAEYINLIDNHKGV